jgi:hypothetical protein
VAGQELDDEQRPFVADAVEDVADQPADGDPLRLLSQNQVRMKCRLP